MDTTIVMACDQEWRKRASAFSEEGRLVTVTAGKIVLRNPSADLVRVVHPRMIQGIRFVGWSFWCTHHLSEAQVRRLEEYLPAHCEPTSPFSDDG